MKQVRQFLRSGAMQAGEVPLPGVRPHEVLVRTHYSFVSMGTEKMKVTQARMNLAAKARERPDQVRQVIQTFKDQGLLPTIRKIQERLKSPATLGYSCAGVVAAVHCALADFVIRVDLSRSRRRPSLPCRVCVSPEMKKAAEVDFTWAAFPRTYEKRLLGSAPQA